MNGEENQVLQSGIARERKVTPHWVKKHILNRFFRL